MWTVFVMIAGCVHPTIKDSVPADTVADTEEPVEVIPLEDGFERDLTLTSASVDKSFRAQWTVVATNATRDVRLSLPYSDFYGDDWTDGAEYDLVQERGYTQILVAEQGERVGEGFSDCPVGYGSSDAAAVFWAVSGNIHVSVGESTADLTLSNIVLECSYPCYDPPTS